MIKWGVPIYAIVYGVFMATIGTKEWHFIVAGVFFGISFMMVILNFIERYTKNVR